MKKIPVIIQHDAMDCGIACVAMLCRWYGIKVSIADLKEICIPTKEGISLKAIATVLERFGFHVLGGRSTIKALVEKTMLPVILHWRQNHFVVLFKITKRRGKYFFHISDPAIGRIIYSELEFEQAWIETENKGIVLLVSADQLSKTVNSKRRHKGFSSLSVLFPYISFYKNYFALLVCGYLCISLVQLILPYLTKSIVDIGIADRDLNFIILILGAQLALLLGTTSVKVVNNWVTLHISTRISLSLISDFLIKLMCLPMVFFDYRQVGDIVQRISDNDRVQSFITTELLTLLYSLITMGVFSIIILIYNKTVFVIFFIFSVLYFVWLLLFMKHRKVLDYKFFRINSENNNVTYRLVEGMQEAKLQNITREQRWKWEDVRVDLFNANMSQMKLSQIQQIGATFINESKNIMVTVMTASLVIRGEITLGMMLAIQYIIGQLSLPVVQLANYIYKFQDVKLSLERINEIKDRSDENSGRGKVFISKDCSMQITNLRFSYEGSESDAIKDVTLEIGDGETVAIVGDSGSGKTTLLKLILQYYTPQCGAISVGGVNLAKVNIQDWWNRCGVVMQDGYIFSDTIAQNIALTSDRIDYKRLKRASEMAMLADFVESLPLRYDTLIGDAGRHLSSGQRQRILIARAIYKDADFLFFDEATNSLDAINERCILQNMDGFIKHKTAIIIAHRLSTVKNADKIVVLKGGQIVESGTHAGLLKKCGFYYKLIENQLENRQI